jgi:hypothetical protein
MASARAKKGGFWLKVAAVAAAVVVGFRYVEGKSSLTSKASTGSKR